MEAKYKTKILVLIVILALFSRSQSKRRFLDDPPSPTENSSSDDNPNPSPSPGQGSQGDNLNNITQIQIGEEQVIRYEVQYDQNGIPKGFASGFYKFKFTQKLEERDAFIMVKGREDFQHSPQMFFSNIDQNPSYSSENSQECGIMGVDICTIPHSYIQTDRYYYLGVYCYDSCTFQIQVIYNPTWFMKVGEVISVSFPVSQGAGAQEIKIAMGNDTSITNLLIQAYILNPSDISDPFHLYVNQGEQAPSSLNHHYLAEQIWFQGQGVLITHQDTYPVWTYNTNYTVLIEAPAGAIIAVTSEGWGDKRKIFLMKNVYDMVDYADFRIYQLTLNDVDIAEGDGISFDLQPFYGNPNIYVHPETMPTTKEGYRWNSKEFTGMESLTITNNQYDMRNQTTVQFYIMVYGQMTASYRLIAYRADISMRFLVYDCTENGYITGQDIVQYQLYTLNLNQTDITISATGLSGSVNLYVKVCGGQNPLDCAITRDEIVTQNSQQLQFFYSEESGSLHKITFQHDPELCRQNTTQNNNGNTNNTDNNAQDLPLKTNCITIVGITNNQFLDDSNNSSNNQSDQQNTTVTHYRLSARHKNSHIVMKENVPYRSWLRLSDQDYYQFTIPDTDDAEQIQKVQFLASAIAGEIDVFVSRKARYPQSNDTQKAGFLYEDSLVFNKATDILKGQTSLAGTYYVTVSGYTSATYDLSVKVMRQNGSLVYSPIERRLYLGYVDFGNLDYLRPETYFYQFDTSDELFPQVQDPLEPPQKLQIFIYFHQYNKTSNQKAANLFFWPTVNIYYRDPATKQDRPVQYADMFYSMDFFQFTILVHREDQGKYMIMLNHSMQFYQDIRLKYFVSINHNNINNLVPEGGGYVAQLNRGESQLFQLFVPQESNFYLEIYECVGRVDVNVSSSLKNIQNGIFDGDAGKKLRDGGSQENLLYWHALKNGPFYFSITPQSIEKNEILKQYQIFDGSIFMLIPHLIKKGHKTPHHYFYPGGRLDYDVSTADGNYTVFVRVPQLNCQKCQDIPYNISYFSYTIHITDSLELIDYFGKCNLGKRNYGFEKSGFKNYSQRVQRHFATKFFEDSGPLNQTIQFQVTTRLIGKGPFYVSAMAVAYINTQTQYENEDPYSFMYDQLIMKLQGNPYLDEETNDNIQEFDYLVLFIIVGGAFVVIGIFVGIYCYQRKYGEAIQEIQMEKQSKQVGDDDDEDVAEQYKQGADQYQMVG